MKKGVFKWIVISVAVVLLLLFAVFLIPKDGTFSWEVFRAKRAVDSFLDAVEREDYEKAYSCVSPETADPEAFRTVWCERVAALRSGVSAAYLKDHSDLSVRKDGGTLTVTVTLDVMRQGFGDKFYDGGNTFVMVKDGSDWKIRAISTEDFSLQTDLEKALSGRELPGDPS